MKEKLELENYNNYLHNFIETELVDYVGSKFYGCDLGNYLTDSINVDGSATYSTYKAIEYIKYWWDEAADVYEYQKMNYGECLHNPFEEPEAFHVCMIIEGVNSILSQCDTVDKYWNDEIELTDEIVKQILEESKEVNPVF